MKVFLLRTQYGEVYLEGGEGESAPKVATRPSPFTRNVNQMKFSSIFHFPSPALSKKNTNVGLPKPIIFTHMGGGGILPKHNFVSANFENFLFLCNQQVFMLLF